MTRDSSAAINDYPTHTLTHGRAQSCISIGLVWSFGTIIKPRMMPLSSDAEALDTFGLSVTL